jgi:hypothetical protein
LDGSVITYVLIALFVPLAAYGLYLWVTGQDPQSRLDREVRRLKDKSRSAAPVIYLRSFESESLKFSDVAAAFAGKTIPGTMCYWKDAGNVVTDFLSVIGPVHALERPVKVVRLRGAAPSRPELVAVPDDRWQQTILEWLAGAALVVIQLDVSSGLKWEIERVAERVPAVRVVLVLPPTQAEYSRIREEVSALFPHSLPVELPPSRVLTFRADWQPLPLRAAEGLGSTWYALEPVFSQNGYEGPDLHKVFS